MFVLNNNQFQFKMYVMQLGTFSLLYVQQLTYETLIIFFL